MNDITPQDELRFAERVRNQRKEIARYQQLIKDKDATIAGLETRIASDLEVMKECANISIGVMTPRLAEWTKIRCERQVAVQEATLLRADNQKLSKELKRLLEVNADQLSENLQVSRNCANLRESNSEFMRQLSEARRDASTIKTELDDLRLKYHARLEELDLLQHENAELKSLLSDREKTIQSWQSSARADGDIRAKLRQKAERWEQIAHDYMNQVSNLERRIYELNEVIGTDDKDAEITRLKAERDALDDAAHGLDLECHRLENVLANAYCCYSSIPAIHLILGNGLCGSKPVADKMRFEPGVWVPRSDYRKLQEALSKTPVLHGEDVNWVTNSLGELGVLVHGQMFFLYLNNRSIKYIRTELTKDIHWRLLTNEEAKSIKKSVHGTATGLPAGIMPVFVLPPATPDWQPLFKEDGNEG